MSWFGVETEEEKAVAMGAGDGVGDGAEGGVEGPLVLEAIQPRYLEGWTAEVSK